MRLVKCKIGVVDKMIKFEHRCFHADPGLSLFEHTLKNFF